MLCHFWGIGSSKSQLHESLIWWTQNCETQNYIEECFCGKLTCTGSVNLEKKICCCWSWSIWPSQAELMDFNMSLSFCCPEATWLIHDGWELETQWHRMYSKPCCQSAFSEIAELMIQIILNLTFNLYWCCVSNIDDAGYHPTQHSHYNILLDIEFPLNIKIQHQSATVSCSFLTHGIMDDNRFDHVVLLHNLYLYHGFS